MKSTQYTVASVADSIIAEIKNDEVLMACKNFVELHDHCDANTLGCSEELLKAVGTERALPILNAAQNEVNLWLVGMSMKVHPEWDSTDMNVECHSAAFKIKHGRNADWNTEEDICDELWFDDIYIKLRAIMKERTGK